MREFKARDLQAEVDALQRFARLAAADCRRRFDTMTKVLHMCSPTYRDRETERLWRERQSGRRER